MKNLLPMLVLITMNIGQTVADILMSIVSVLTGKTGNVKVDIDGDMNVPSGNGKTHILDFIGQLVDMVKNAYAQRVEFNELCQYALTQKMLHHPRQYRNAIRVYCASHDVAPSKLSVWQRVEALFLYSTFNPRSMVFSKHHGDRTLIEKNKETVLRMLLAVGIITISKEDTEKMLKDDAPISDTKGGFTYSLHVDKAVQILGQKKGNALPIMLVRGVLWTQRNEFNKLRWGIKKFIASLSEEEADTNKQVNVLLGEWASVEGNFVVEHEEDEDGNVIVKGVGRHYDGSIAGLDKKDLVLNGVNPRSRASMETLKRNLSIYYMVRRAIATDYGISEKDVTIGMVEDVLNRIKPEVEDYDPIMTETGYCFTHYGVCKAKTGNTALYERILDEFPETTFVIMNMKDASKHFADKEGNRVSIKHFLKAGIILVKSWVTEEVIDDENLRRQVVVTPAVPDETEHLVFVGISAGGMKQGHYVFASVPEQYKDTPNTWVASMWAQNMGFHKKAQEILDMKDENKAFDYFVEEVLKDANAGLTKNGEANIGTIIARMSMMLSTIIHIDEPIDVNPKEVYFTPEVKEELSVPAQTWYAIKDFFARTMLNTIKIVACEGAGYMNFKYCVKFNVAVKTITKEEAARVEELHDKFTEGGKVNLASKEFRKKLKTKEGKEFNTIFKKMATVFQCRCDGGMKLTLSLCDFKRIRNDVICVKVGDPVIDEANRRNGVLGRKCCDLGILMNGSGVKYYSPDWYKRISICSYSKEGHSKIRIGDSVWNMLNPVQLEGDDSLGMDLIKYIKKHVLKPLRKAELSKEACIDFLKAYNKVLDISVDDNNIGTKATERVEALMLLQTAPNYFYTSEFHAWFREFVEKLWNDTQRCSIVAPGHHKLVIPDYAHAFNVWLRPCMEAACAKHNAQADINHQRSVDAWYHVTELREIVSNKVKNNAKNYSGVAVFNGITGKNAEKPVYAIAWRYPCYSHEEVKRLLMLDSEYHWFLHDTLVLDGAEAVINGMQDGDFDGDHLTFTLTNTEIGKLMNKYVDGTQSTRLDTPEWAEGITERAKQSVDVTFERILDQLERYDKRDNTGKISISASNALNLANSLEEILRIMRILKINTVQFMLPDMDWGIKEIDNAQGFEPVMKGKKDVNPLNTMKVTENEDEADKCYFRQRKGLVIDIEGELAKYSDDVLDKIIVRDEDDKNKRHFLGWAVTSKNGPKRLLVEMPLRVDTFFEIVENGEEMRATSIHEWVPFVRKLSPEEDALAIELNEAKRQAMMATLDKKTGVLKKDQFRFGGTYIRNGEESVLSGSRPISIKKLEELKNLYYLIGELDGYETGREIDKLKKIIGAIMDIEVPMIATCRVFADVVKGKLMTERKARQAYVSCSPINMVHEYVANIRKKNKTRNEAKPSFVPYCIALMSQEDRKMLYKVWDDVRDIESEYLSKVVGINKRDQAEEYQSIIDDTRSELYEVAYNADVDIETIALVTYFVGCERSARENVLNGTTSFSWILKDEFLSLFENDSSNVAVVKVPKKISADKVIVENGWVIYLDSDENGNELKQLVMRVGDNDYSTTNFTFYEGDNGNYVTVRRGTTTRVRSIYDDVYTENNDGSLVVRKLGIPFNIRLSGMSLNVSRDDVVAMAKPKKIGNVDYSKILTVEFGLDEETKAITVYAINGKTRIAIGFAEIYTHDDRVVIESGYLFDNDNNEYNRVVFGSDVLLSLIGKKYRISLDNCGNNSANTFLQDVVIVAAQK